jgi:hypothetical protein
MRMKMEQEVKDRFEGLDKRVLEADHHLKDVKSEMEVELKTSLEALDKRFVEIDKRFDDIKWFIGGVTGIATIIFSVLMLVLSWNYNEERTSLHEFEKDLKADLGKGELQPELELLGSNGELLSGQEVKAEFRTDKDGSMLVYIDYGLRNVGGGTSGPLYVKFYASDPINLTNRSTDDPNFQHEAYANPTDLTPSELPGKYSTDFNLHFDLAKNSIPPRGKYLAQIKMFYGKGRFVSAKFYLVVS